MKIYVKLIIFGLLITRLQSYVLFETTQIDDEGRNDVTEPVVGSTFTHIGKIVKPSEIREPKTLQEIINFVGSEKLSNSDVIAPEPEGGEETLTYKELLRRLALWQLAQQQNYYEMQQAADSNKNIENDIRNI